MFETEKFSLIANNLFLDFVNTLKIRDGKPFETIETFRDFLGWTISVGLLSNAQATDLFEKWNDNQESRDFLNKAKDFRKILLESAGRIVAGKMPNARILSEINEILKTGSGFTEIEKTGNRFEKRFRLDLTNLANLLHPIAESFADFLCYGQFELLRKCENANCVLYFYDRTKNHRRRWCSMKACGNQAKAAAFYRRKKESAGNP